MAHLPLPEAQLITQFGPHLNYEPPGGWHAGGQPDRLVKTHCCFCGVQCGIQLKVKDEKVVGFEPWTEFPVNQGKLGPKGVKRYLQNNHPDRILSPLQRTPKGFEEVPWDKALSLVTDNMQRIQRTYGKDAFAILSGASMTNEKSYLMGKFTRVALGTANIDYNGRLCMVSAGAGNKMAFGRNRAANPWSDIPLAKCIIVTGSNVGECFPILTDYIWRARDNGAKLIVIDPCMTPIGRTADLFLPVRPGRDSALMNGILQVMSEHDWIDQEFIAAHTMDFDKVREAVAPYTPQYTAEITGVPAANIRKAAEMWGEAQTLMLLHARGIEHHTKGVENVLSCINLKSQATKFGPLEYKHDTESPTLRQQQNTVLSLVALFVLMFLCLQLWLLVETLDTAFHSTADSALPAIIVSAVCALARPYVHWPVGGCGGSFSVTAKGEKSKVKEQKAKVLQKMKKAKEERMSQNAFQREHIVEQIQTFFRGVHDISDFYYRLYLLNGFCKMCDGRGYLHGQSEPCPQCYASGKADRWQIAPQEKSEPAAE